MTNSIPVKGLTPVTSEKNGNIYKVNVWNRTYTISESPIFSSILTNGQEALYSPVRLAGRLNGQEIKWEEFKNLKMVDETEKSQTFIQSAVCQQLCLNTTIEVFYDGCVKCSARIQPTGRTKKMTTYPPENNVILDKLWLEVPLKKDFAKFYHTFPQYDKIYLDGVCKESHWSMLALQAINALPKETIWTGFKHSFYLGNDHSGLSTFFETNEGWNAADEEHVIEVFVKEDHVLLRVHLLDSEHEYWRNKCEWKGMHLFPIEFKFGMQATPVKPFVGNPYEACYHDGGVRYEAEGEGVETLFNPVKGSESPELLIDRLQRAGVKTVYVHETWNDIQNSVYLTDESEDRLIRMVKAAHDRGMKIAPYFGFEIASFSPMAVNMKNYRVINIDENYNGSQYPRRPYQRDYQVCYKSDIGKYWVDGVMKLMDKYHFDGIYLDGTFTARGCKNQSHGCGWRDKDGKLHETHAIWALRSMLEDLCTKIKQRGGFINAHTSNNFSIPCIAFADSCWDGEPIQNALLSGLAESIPEGHIRAMFTGRNLGVPVYMICYTNATWTFHNACSCVIPFGLLPKPGTIEGLEEMEKVWRVYETIPMEKATFKPYFENGVTTTNEFVKASYFDYEGKSMAIVANLKKQETGKVEVTLDQNYKSAVNKVTGEKIDVVDGNKIYVEYSGFDYSLIELTK